jgi:hypothetical protein
MVVARQRQWTVSTMLLLRAFPLAIALLVAVPVTPAKERLQTTPSRRTGGEWVMSCCTNH